jgi:hypothetical protein
VAVAAEGSSVLGIDTQLSVLLLLLLLLLLQVQGCCGCTRHCQRDQRGAWWAHLPHHHQARQGSVHKAGARPAGADTGVWVGGWVGGWVGACVRACVRAWVVDILQ